MSFAIFKAGQASDVAADMQTVRMQSTDGEKTRDYVVALLEGIEPSRVVVVDMSGHVDANNVTVSISIRTAH